VIIFGDLHRDINPTGGEGGEIYLVIERGEAMLEVLIFRVDLLQIEVPLILHFAGHFFDLSTRTQHLLELSPQHISFQLARIVKDGHVPTIVRFSVAAILFLRFDCAIFIEKSMAFVLSLGNHANNEWL
jgi:hypothetical protein